MVLLNAKELAKIPFSEANIVPAVSAALYQTLNSGLAEATDLADIVENEEQHFINPVIQVHFSQREIADEQLPEELTR